jgi:hypothetical protein
LANLENKAQLAKLNNNTIFNLKLIASGLSTNIDLLYREKYARSWQVFLIKVKFRTDRKDVEDLAYQKIICDLKNIPVSKFHIIYVNSDYELQARVSYKKLVKVKDLTAKVLNQSEKIAEDLDKLKQILAGQRRPNKSLKKACLKPKLCQFYDKCWAKTFKDVDYPIYTLKENPKLGMKLFYKHKYTDLTDIDPKEINHNFNIKQKIQLNACKTNQIHVDQPELKKYLKKIKYPVSFLDFESYNCLKPFVSGFKPLEHVPFLYSLHVSSKMSKADFEQNLLRASDSKNILKNAKAPSPKTKHYEFLTEDSNLDNLTKLASKLYEDLPKTGTIFAFNVGFEKHVIKLLSRFEPRLIKYLPRFVDLMTPFEQNWIYHPEFHGLNSLKQISKALLNFDYADLDINNGMLAMYNFQYLISEKNKEKYNAQIFQDLKVYCKQDTLSLLLIFSKLHLLNAT